MFLVNWIMSAMRLLGSCSRQKSCMIGDTPARNPIRAAAPSFGFTPSKMLAPPRTGAAPVDRHFGLRYVFGAGVLCHRFGLKEVI